MVDWNPRETGIFVETYVNLAKNQQTFSTIRLNISIVVYGQGDH
jgi:hypothetical protein